MTDTLRQELQFYLSESLRKVREAWTRLDEQQIWWRPNEACLAPANQLIHLTGNVRQWVGTALMQLDEVRTRDAEFAARGGLDKDQIFRAFEEQVHQMQQRLTEAQDWTSPHVVQGHPTTELGIWIHMVEHLSYHTGQLLYTVKAMTGEPFDFYADWDLG